MMFAVLMMLASGSFGAPLKPLNISVHCEKEYFVYPGISLLELAPSPLAELSISLSVEDGRNMLNVSWAIAIDSTAKYIEATRVNVGQKTLRCEYVPSIAEAISQGLIPNNQEQVWFSEKIRVFPADLYHVQAANLPLPPPENGPPYKTQALYSPRQTASQKAPEVKVSTSPNTTPAAPHSLSLTPLLVSIGAGSILALALLIFGYVTYKIARSTLSVGFQKVCSGPQVPVLLVYPAEGAVFQGAVVALAEFLQEHAGCSVEVDLWQQGSVAKLGPLRWLHEKVQAAHRVLILAPQLCPPPSSLKSSSPGVNAPPASAQDLFPLALNLLAAQAKNSTDLAKFWVVRFGESGLRTPELQPCRSFCLMKDLNKLCRGLRSDRSDDRNRNITDLLMRRADFCTGTRAERLQDAVQALHQP